MLGVRGCAAPQGVLFEGMLFNLIVSYVFPWVYNLTPILVPIGILSLCLFVFEEMMNCRCEGWVRIKNRNYII